MRTTLPCACARTLPAALRPLASLRRCAAMTTRLSTLPATSLPPSAPCLDSELTEFPLRMRDWLKNVLVTLYERDEENNLLTEKQKLRVKKIHENEKRLEAGDHPVELLARDFEKNYNMYIFPVHWQFGQLDQHPIDGYLSHTELAPLRAPLIPMEHCTTRFFETCDLDNDKYIALDEWAGCFGIKEKDIDKDLVI
ncbi:secreted protein acidic and cysteine rich [Rhinolophus ferrumequinum]|uniref:Secreted protein acidic and cysteine rich n=1 Tax=Rhinolophus ferrumequinum TaxID=59479 RepID=A0A7J7RYW4_RHIFE|nr:secreted protein acidic and cysteine rich [Rhinolophus ferrumequinum]